MPFIHTIRLHFHEQLNGGVQLLLRRFLELAYLLPLMLLWRTLLGDSGTQTGVTLSQMLTYTYLNALLAPQLNVQSPASNALYSGVIIGLYQRPMGIFMQLTAQTVGGWLPRLVLFSLPMALVAPFFGIRLIPATFWAFGSLILAISLGFAMDYIFASLMLYMRNVMWLVYVLRMAIISLFSGAVIPFSLLPFGIGNIMALLPFGSLAGAPLALYAGLESPLPVIALQIFWNITLWPLAIYVFGKSRERMVSYGG